MSSCLPEGADPAADLRALTRALARGDDIAWAQFHADYGPAIFRQLLALTRGDHDVAKEALQHTYLRVAKHLRPCDAEPMFKAWLRTVARTALLDCWRRRRTFKELLFRKQQEPPELADPAVDDRLMTALDTTIARLAPEDRALLEAKYFSGQDVRTLAESLAISPKATESRLTRARETLRRELLLELQRHE
ncbi:MAG: sigma-70 family RNA polymerase sigma factor [Opitutaceae bacterium]|nr:sigma-70 family RNA polymerase sigma factor [Opitutaceae bacterium]MBP9912034.1 sigma-70 family RNA polymerase sigma factor [Opitutaceae bacterium]